MENQWKEYFMFTKKERTGIIFLLLLVGMIVLLPFFFSDTAQVPDRAAFEQWQRQIAQLQEQRGPAGVDKDKDREESFEASREPAASPANKQPVLFVFDPNTLSEEGWQKLGVREKTVRTIRNYLAKGGRFRKPEDLGKIYGLQQQEALRLIPYVQITAPVSSYEKKFEQTKNENNFPKKAKTIPVVDINAADTTAFIALPGIGSKLAQRIVNFREKLGGFYVVEQVGETYALPDSTFQRIRFFLQCQDPVVKKININTADVNVLKQHPYIRWQIANAIIQYRQQHGPFPSVEALQQIMVLPPEVLKKISPYLAIE